MKTGGEPHDLERSSTAFSSAVVARRGNPSAFRGQQEDSRRAGRPGELSEWQIGGSTGSVRKREIVAYSSSSQSCLVLPGLAQYLLRPRSRPARSAGGNSPGRSRPARNVEEPVSRAGIASSRPGEGHRARPTHVHRCVQRRRRGSRRGVPPVTGTATPPRPEPAFGDSACVAGATRSGAR